MTTWNNLPSFPIGSQYVAARTLLGNPCAVSGPLVAISAANTTGLVPTIQADGTIAWAAGGAGGGITGVTTINGLNGGGSSGAVTVGLAVHAINAIATLNNITGPALVGKAAAGAGQAAAITATASSNAVMRESAGSAGWGTIVAEALADGALRADAVGRAKMATDYFDAATVLLKIADGAFAADAATRALFGDGIWPLAKTNFHLGPYTATAANDFDLTSLLGDAVNGYDITIRGSTATSAFFDILLNGTDTCDAMYHMFNDGGAFNSGTGAGPGVISATADNVVYVRIWTKTGLRRRCQVYADGTFSGTARQYFLSGEWTDTAAAVTSLRLRPAGGVNWTAGTIANVRAF